jgi:hypothetical protein
MLDNNVLKSILERHAPGVDAVGDGIFSQRWLSTETFYRFTEDYVSPEKRLLYKLDLERAFPGKQGVL